MTIGFGELRKKSLEWQTEISTVEKRYARDWLLKGIYERPILAEALVLREASALNKVYFAEYPQVDEIDLGRTAALDEGTLEEEFEGAVQAAAQLSGLHFRLHTLQPTEARVEFTGPLGRRSAAQPLLVVRMVNKAPRLAPVTRQMLYPFSDTCVVTVRAVALEELAAERIVLFAGKPRARDVFDLWFILTHAGTELDLGRTLGLAETIAAEKRLELRRTVDESYVPLLERAWGNALKGIPKHPPFAQAQLDIETGLMAVFGVE